MERYYYASSIAEFVIQSRSEILGKLAMNTDFSLEITQREAWIAQIDLLKKNLHSYEGQIIFEYSIPRLGKRVDVVLIISGVILVLEFKVGARECLRCDIEQVWDYALDLKNFHEASHSLTIVPILVATEAMSQPVVIEPCSYADLVYAPIVTNRVDLQIVIQNVLLFNAGNKNIEADWINSRYSPTPTIIEAASSLYNNHSVEDITRKEASAKNLTKTSQFVVKVIEQAKQKQEKAICFVTGVPGAGKTLVGLNVAIEQFKKQDLAVYLSGN